MVKFVRESFGVINLLLFLKVWYNFWAKVSCVDLGNMLNQARSISLPRVIVALSITNPYGHENLSFDSKQKKDVTSTMEQHIPGLIKKRYNTSRFLKGSKNLCHKLCTSKLIESSKQTQVVYNYTLLSQTSIC